MTSPMAAVNEKDYSYSLSPYRTPPDKSASSTTRRKSYGATLICSVAALLLAIISLGLWIIFTTKFDLFHGKYEPLAIAWITASAGSIWLLSFLVLHVWFWRRSQRPMADIEAKRSPNSELRVLRTRSKSLAATSNMKTPSKSSRDVRSSYPLAHFGPTRGRTNNQDFLIPQASIQQGKYHTGITSLKATGPITLITTAAPFDDHPNPLACSPSTAAPMSPVARPPRPVFPSKAKLRESEYAYSDGSPVSRRLSGGSGAEDPFEDSASEVGA